MRWARRHERPPSAYGDNAATVRMAGTEDTIRVGFAIPNGKLSEHARFSSSRTAFRVGQHFTVTISWTNR